MKKILITILALGALVGQVCFSVRTARAQYQNGDTAKVVDVTTACNDIPEDAVATRPASSWPPVDWQLLVPPFISLPLIPFILPAPLPPVGGYNFTAPLGYLDWSIETFSEAVQTGQFFQNEVGEPPSVSLQFSSNGDQENEEFRGVVTPQNFLSELRELNFGWFEKKSDGQLLSLNGVVAGGLPFKQSEGEERCATVVRDVADDFDRDENRDGMGDTWAERYGITDANADPDQDGYDGTDIFKQNIDTDLNQVIDSLYVVPAARSATGGDVHQYGRSDNGQPRFSNLDEYIWGTNPLDPDTDDDGYPDEADVVGVGQNTIVIRPKLFEGDHVDIEINTLGETLLTDENEEVVTQILGYSETLNIHPTAQLAASVEVTPTQPKVGDLVRFTVEAGSSRARSGHLQYAWAIDGTPIENYTDDAFLCQGQGLGFAGYNNVLTCKVQPNSSGSQHTVAIQVYDPLEGTRTETTATLVVGDVVISSHQPAVIPQRPFDVSKKTTIPPRFVEVVASLSSNSDAQSYDYWWYVDQVRVNTVSCSSVPLTLPQDVNQVTTFKDNLVYCGRGTNYLYFEATKGDAHDYVVDVRVNDTQTGRRYGLAEEIIRHDPTANVIPVPGSTGTEQVALVPTTSDSLPLNGTMTLTAQVPAITDQTLEYAWYVNDMPVARGPYETQYTVHGSMVPSTVRVRLEIVDQVSEKVVKSEEKAIAVINTAPTLQDRGATALASLQTSISNNYVSWLVQYIFFGLVALGVWLGIQGSLRKQNATN